MRPKAGRSPRPSPAPAGWIAALLTEVPGSSAVVERGFVTYSNQAKTEMLGVSADLIAEHGAVSESVARAMAQGALVHSRADGGRRHRHRRAGRGDRDEAGRPGAFRAGRAGSAHLHLERRYGDLGRATVRGHAVEDALSLLERALAETA